MESAGRGLIKSERRRLVEEAWRRFVQDGEGPAGVREEIAASWRRSSQSHHVDPAIQRPGRILSPEALEAIRTGDEVFALADPVLRDFSSRVDLTHHALAYFDRSGWMLSIDGDGKVRARLERIGFAPGTSWAEESAGTNGPGTALATGLTTEVFASEHFVEAWHPWTCAASPILSPGDARPVGLVDITGPWELHRRQALLAARAIARAIEERLRAVQGVRDEVARFAFREARQSGDAVVAVDRRGRVLASNDAAERRRIVCGGALRAGMAEALAEALLSRRDGEIAGPDGRPVLLSPLCYEGAAIGAILRLGAAPAARRARPAARSGARYVFESILGGDAPSFRRALELARTAARNDLPAVVSGESGTGKELFAHAIHNASARRDGPFVAVNCGSIPEQLVEAELFGYEAGTFTGARQGGSAGRFEDADGGTLFLDEVSELPPQAQVALLRVLQEKEVVRLGSSAARPVDVRVVAATNRPLEQEIEEGRFRRDLYYRLNVLSIALPPLRERGEDVILLARFFLGAAADEVGREGLELTGDALAALRTHPWIGNVRELRNVILRAAATAPEPRIRAEDLGLEPTVLEPPAAHRGPARPRVTGRPPQPATPTPLREATVSAERTALLAALDACGWNYAAAAEQLGISRMTLYRRLSKCGISRQG